MAKIKLTKGELKRQRDALAQYERYLPTLQLKKQQLQLEILRQVSLLEEKTGLMNEKKRAIEIWAGLLSDPEIDMKDLIAPKELVLGTRNIAGVDLPVLEQVIFKQAEYDLFTTPLWVDAGIEALRDLFSVIKEIDVTREGIGILRHELRIATQRVNLFEKVKIPDAMKAIHLIKIYLGDQMANAVGRCKIAKRKIEATAAAGVGA